MERSAEPPGLHRRAGSGVHPAGRWCLAAAARSARSWCHSRERWRRHSLLVCCRRSWNCSAWCALSFSEQPRQRLPGQHSNPAGSSSPSSPMRSASVRNAHWRVESRAWRRSLASVRARSSGSMRSCCAVRSGVASLCGGGPAGVSPASAPSWEESAAPSSSTQCWWSWQGAFLWHPLTLQTWPVL